MTQPGHGRLPRFGAAIAMAAIGALTLAACGGSDDTSSSSGASGSAGGAAKKITFTFPTATNTESPYETLAKKYTTETGVAIEAKKLPNDSYGVTLRTQLQGGNAADLIVVAPGRGESHAVLPLADAGFLEPLDETSAKLVPEGSKDLFLSKDKAYAQPTDLVPVGMIWNTTAAGPAGIEYPADSDAMLQACATATQKGKSFIALAGSAPPNLGLMAMSISASRVYRDTPDWNTQRTEGKVTFADSQGWKDTVQLIVDMNKAGCFQKGAAGGGFDAITQGIGRANALAAFVPGGAAQEIMNNAPVKLEVRAFPQAPGTQPHLLASANYAFSINAKADAGAKQAAQAFLDWLAKPENAAQFTKIEGQVPITGIETAELLPQYAPIKDLLVKGDYAPLPNQAWPNPAIYDTLAKGLQGLITGQGDVASVLSATDKAWGK